MTPSYPLTTPTTTRTATTMGKFKKLLTDRQEAQRLGKLYPKHVNQQAMPSIPTDLSGAKVNIMGNEYEFTKHTKQPTDTLGSTDTDNPRICDFCGLPSTHDAVRKLVATPSVAICNECIETAVFVMYADGVPINVPEKYKQS